MKKMNSTSDFSAMRSRVLHQQFREALALQSFTSCREAFRTVVKRSAPRFWVSEERAADVVCKMFAGEDPTATMFPEKRAMYQEIYSRCLRLREALPKAPVAAMVFEVVNQEAPRHYMSEHTLERIINQERRRRRAERGAR